jgi:hypothetical protein
MFFKMIDIESHFQEGIFTMRDEPGSGKSYVVLATILAEKRMHGKTQNLLVVPDNIHDQWINYINGFSTNSNSRRPELTMKSFTNYGEMNKLLFDPNILLAYDILLTTPIYYKTISETISMIRRRFNRVILDEIDSISFFTQINVPSKIVWLVSATSKLMTTDNYFKSRTKAVIECEKSFINKSINLPPINYMKCECFNQYYNTLKKIMPKKNIDQVNAIDYSKFKFKYMKQQQSVSSIDSLLKSTLLNLHQEISVKEDEINETIKNIPNNHVFSIMNQVRDLMESFFWEHYLGPMKDMVNYFPLNNDVVNETISVETGADFIDELLSITRNSDIEVPYRLTSETVEVFRDKCENLLNSIQVPLRKLSKREELYIEDILKLKGDISEARQKIEIVTSDLKELDKNKCPICLSSSSLLKEMECCQGKFCNDCISQMNKCPGCRFKINKVIVKDNFDNKCDKFGLQNTDKDIVICNLIDEITTNSRAVLGDYKLLIFSDFSGTFNLLYSFLSKRNQNYSEIEGSIESIQQTIDDYKSGKVKILLIDSLHYGAGLNLHETTDVILIHRSERRQQIIGRAQRIGRQIPLNVHELLYQNE